MKIYKDCPTPEKVYNSKGSLAQHIRGVHGEGWVAFCGDQLKWKGKYHRHLNKCTKCGAINKQAKKKDITSCDLQY